MLQLIQPKSSGVILEDINGMIGFYTDNIYFYQPTTYKSYMLLLQQRLESYINKSIALELKPSTKNLEKLKNYPIDNAIYSPRA